MNGEKFILNQPGGIKLLFRTLRYKNFRLYFIGQGISLSGTWMQQMALAWLVYRLTNSPFLLGMVGFASQLPVLLLSPLTGVLADRWDRRRILVIDQTVAMVQALVLAVLTLTNVINVWQIMVLAVLIGIISAFEMPTRQSFVVDLVEKVEDYGNAIALHSFLFNSARLIGPSLAGILIKLTGEGVCFLLNGVSFLAVIWALLAIKVPAKERVKVNHKVRDELKEGFVYVFKSAPLRSIILLVALNSLMAMSYMVIMPVFARDVLKGGPQTLGFLMAAASVGALLGSVFLASRRNVLGLGKAILTATAILGLGLLALSFSRVVWLALVLMLVVGIGIMVQMTGSNTILQTIVADDKRGRVMSIHTMAFIGLATFGSLIAGGLISQIGVRNTLLINGLACLLGSFVFARPLFSRYETISPEDTRISPVP